MPSVAASVSVFISSVLSGSMTEPVSRNSRSERRRRRRSRRPAAGGRARLCFWSMKRAVLPETSTSAPPGGVEVADLVDGVLRAAARAPARRARSSRRRRPSDARTNGVAAADARRSRDPLAASAASCGRRRAAAHRHGDRLGDVARVVRPRRTSLAAYDGCAGGTASALGPVSDRAEQRRGGGEQQRRCSRARPHRPAHHAAREAVPAVGLVGDRRARGGSTSALMRAPSSASSDGTTSIAITADRTPTAAPATPTE